MKDYDHIAELVQAPNPEFEEFFADMQRKLPALQGKRGNLSIPEAGFKQALKIAYVAGGADTIARIQSL